ncbi:hypothetical protein OAE88_00505 [bacterium]|nr:hypothetical protein [bacterium]
MSVIDDNIWRKLIIKGGLFDDWRTNNGYNTNIRYGVQWEDSYTWRDAENPSYALRRALKEGVPIWFIKRHIKYIAQQCVWVKSDRGHSYGSDYADEENFHELKRLSMGGSVLVSVDIEPMILEHSNRISEETEIINGVKIRITKDEIIPKKRYFVNSTRDMGIYSGKIIKLWETVRYRFHRINPIECGVCGNEYMIIKHNKKKDFYMSDKICQNCAKGYYRAKGELEEREAILKLIFKKDKALKKKLSIKRKKLEKLVA